MSYSFGVTRSPKAAPPHPTKPKAPEPTGEDLVLIHGRTDDGKGLKVIRKRDTELSVGEVRPLEEGKPIGGEVVSLSPRAESPLLCDVRVEADLRPAVDGRAGPVRVSSSSYRSGWDRMWGKRPRAAKAN